MSSSAPPDTDTRCGLVAIIGVPNAGKSTLLNHLVGEGLSAVTDKAQTTRQRITGIRTDGSVQMIFLDTPGLLDPRTLLQRGMLAAARDAAEEADVLLAVLDAAQPGSRQGRTMLRDLVAARTAGTLVVAVNKVDDADAAAVDSACRWAEIQLGAPAIPISARSGSGVDVLLREVGARLPAGPFLYPADDLSAESLRFFVRERIRETVFEQYRQEVPYSTVVEVGDFREAEEPVYIQATLFVERNSQKGILIGDRGAAIRTLGQTSRAKIEDLLGQPVYLDLWVKVLPNWRRKAPLLQRFGYRVPDEP